MIFFFFNDTATTEIYTLSLHDALPILVWTYTGDTPLIGQIGLGNFSALSDKPESAASTDFVSRTHVEDPNGEVREEEDRKSTRLNSSHANISYAVFCLKKKKHNENLE